jgi:serine/threonine protein kinase
MCAQLHSQLLVVAVFSAIKNFWQRAVGGFALDVIQNASRPSTTNITTTLVAMEAFSNLQLLVQKPAATLYVAKSAWSSSAVCIKRCRVTRSNRQLLEDEVAIMRLLRSQPASKAAIAQTLLLPGQEFVMPLIEADVPPTPSLYEQHPPTQHVSMVMEYCRQGDLFSWAEKNRPVTATGPARMDTATYLTVLKYTLQTLLALYHVHSKGCAHLDLSLENILVADDGNVRLADFGISVQRDVNWMDMQEAKAADWSLVGTFGWRGRPAYAAPEVYSCLYGKSAPYDAQAADRWSMGVVLYEALTGLPLWHHPNVNNDFFLRCMHEGALEYKKVFDLCVPAGVPTGGRDLANLVASMLVYEPTKRQSLTSLLRQVNALIKQAEPPPQMLRTDKENCVSVPNRQLAPPTQTLQLMLQKRKNPEAVRLHHTPKQPAPSNQPQQQQQQQLHAAQKRPHKRPTLMSDSRIGGAGGSGGAYVG